MTRVDVELICDGCSRETLAADGCWSSRCWACGSTRRVAVRHDHVLAFSEAEAIGYTIVPVGEPALEQHRPAATLDGVPQHTPDPPAEVVLRQTDDMNEDTTQTGVDDKFDKGGSDE